MKATPTFLLSILVLLCLLPYALPNKQVKALDILQQSKLAHRTNTSYFDLNAIFIHTQAPHLPQARTKQQDAITKLPGQPSVGFSQFGGYITVNPSSDRALYYYFVEATDSKHSRPLLLWFNGGPGCSSLGYGAMEEIGPFRVHSDGKSLYLNEYSWNNAANVLFVESPAGVGFSYSDEEGEMRKGGDRRTAIDNYVFLVNWLERFPEYQGREVFLAGESYAGHYVPQLARIILMHHNNGRKIVNLKGVLMGNPLIDEEMDAMGIFEFYGSHALISPEAASSIKSCCSFVDGEDDPNPAECKAAALKAEKDVSDLNIYNIYAPSCFLNGTTSTPKNASPLVFDPCTDNYVHAYLNSPDVQEAMNVDSHKIPSENWEFCSEGIRHWADSPSSVLPMIRELLDSEIRVLIFSGDFDGRIPVTSTQYAIKKMKVSVKREWHPWFNVGEVAGYTVVYEGGLTYATVMGAGHQVPSFQPRRALSMVAHFLAGLPLPRTNTYH